jgi:hypothetical protein
MSGVPERSTSWISSCDPILPSLPAKSSFKFASGSLFRRSLVRAPRLGDYEQGITIDGFTFLTDAERRCRKGLGRVWKRSNSFEEGRSCG